MSSYHNFNVSNWTWKKNEEYDLYELTSDMEVSFEDENGKFYFFIVHKGALTDGGSVPFIFRSIVPSWEKEDNNYNACFVLHDALYSSEHLSKEAADDILRSSLRDLGHMSRLKAGAVHRAVLLFAKKHYGRDYDEHGMRFFVSRLA